MAQIAEVNIGNLQGAVRIDAEYYQPDFLRIDEMLDGEPKLKMLVKRITDFGAYSQMNFVNFVESGVRFLRNQDIGEIVIKDESSVYIENEVYNRLSLKLEDGDILTPRVGTLGNAAIVQPNILPASANQNLAQIKPDNAKINPWYLCTFLCSDFGKKQFVRLATGNVQPWLNLQQIESIRVFKPSTKKQNEIGYVVTKAIELQEKSRKLMHNAESLLIEELGLDQFFSKRIPTYETNFESLLSAARMDAEYFQPKHEVMVDRIRSYKHGWKPLPELMAVSKQKIQPNPEEEYGYVELADVNSALGIVQEVTQLQGKELPSRGRMKLKRGDVLVSSVEGSLDKVALVTEDRKDLIGSTGFFVLRSKQFTPEVNLALLRSAPIQLLFKREAQGTILTAIPHKSLDRIPVPQLPENVQKEITALIQGSHSATCESKNLLEDAKKQVEDMISSRAA